jgi:hypothetical protein
MFGLCSGVDRSIVPTTDTIEKTTASVCPHEVPAHVRTLTNAEEEIAKSKIIAAYLVVNGSTDLAQRLQGTPETNRQVMHRFSDLDVLAFLISSIFYSPSTLNDIIQNICKPSAQSSWDMTQIATLLTLVWKAKFSLRIDRFTVYFLPRNENHGHHRLSIPIQHFSRLNNVISLYAIGELIFRHTLWHKRAVTKDKSAMCLENFAYDAELRQMIFRSALCANIIVFAMQKGGHSKTSILLGALENVKSAWDQHPEEFNIPLTSRDLLDLDNIILILSKKNFQINELNRFTSQIDLITSKIYTGGDGDDSGGGGGGGAAVVAQEEGRCDDICNVLDDDDDDDDVLMSILDDDDDD